jgi:hypothetical protein
MEKPLGLALVARSSAGANETRAAQDFFLGADINPSGVEAAWLRRRAQSSPATTRGVSPRQGARLGISRIAIGAERRGQQRGGANFQSLQRPQSRIGCA